jgi:predicted outer membrane protein
MRRVAIASIVALAVAAAVAVPRTAAAAPLHLQDRAFMTYALEQDLAQIAFGALAAEKAADPEVKRFAAGTVAYHRGSTERLQASARRLDVKPPTALSPVAQRTEATLKGLAGPAFDRAYLTSQVIGNFNGMYSARREMAHGPERASLHQLRCALPLRARVDLRQRRAGEGGRRRGGARCPAAALARPAHHERLELERSLLLAPGRLMRPAPATARWSTSPCASPSRRQRHGKRRPRRTGRASASPGRENGPSPGRACPRRGPGRWR